MIDEPSFPTKFLKSHRVIPISKDKLPNQTVNLKSSKRGNGKNVKNNTNQADPCISVENIRQSSYKLRRTLSKTKSFHSIEKKNPLVIPQQSLQSRKKSTNQITFRSNSKKKLETLITQEKENQDSYQNQESYQNQSHTVNTSMQSKQQTKSFFSNNNAGHRQNQNMANISSLYDFLQETSSDRLQQSELLKIKGIWELCQSLKRKDILKVGCSRIEKIIKVMLVQYSKPNFTALFSSQKKEEQQLIKIPLCNSSRRQEFYESNTQSLNNTLFKDESTANNTRAFHTLNQNNGVIGREQKECSPNIELKKIMYILDDKSRMNHEEAKRKSKRVKSVLMEQEEPYRQKHQNQERVTKKYESVSSFDGKSRCSSGITICEMEKCSLEYQKKSQSWPQKEQQQQQCEQEYKVPQRRAFDDCPFSPTTQQTPMKLQFAQNEHQESEQEEQSLEDTSFQICQRSQFQQSSMHSSCGSPVQSSHRQHQNSKTAVLADIVNMLNTKYHKNIDFRIKK